MLIFSVVLKFDRNSHLCRCFCRCCVSCGKPNHNLSQKTPFLWDLCLQSPVMAGCWASLSNVGSRDGETHWLVAWLAVRLPFSLPFSGSESIEFSRFVYLPTCLPAYLPTYLPAYVPTCLYLPIYLSIHLPIYLSTHRSLFPYISLSIYLSIYLPIYLSIYPTTQI